MKLRLIVPVVCVALTTAALHAAPVNTGASSPAAGTASQPPNRHSSQLALRILDQVEQARQSLTAKQTKTAVEHINRALADRDRLTAMSPATSQPVIVPLYWEFDDTSVLGRAMATRKDGKQLPSKSSPITVDQAGTQYTFVGLDLNKVRTRLDNAKSALSEDHPKAAAGSLDRIGDELVVMTVKAEYPLLAARENLGLAEIAITNGRYTEAAAALKEAGTTLDQYASGQSAHRPHEAKSLSKRIDALAQTIKQDHANASSKIDGWWNEVNGWFTHPIKD
ncbi:MAG: YfdX family protein [Acidobacteriaceae bacterium]